VTDSLEFPWFTIRDIAGGLWQLATQPSLGGFTGPQGLTGPIGISSYLATTAAVGVGPWLQLLALLSVALGLTNLLPLPALDGGRIAVVLLESLRRQPFNRERELVVQRAGLVALLVLVAFISYLDITRLVNHQFPGPH
jgi:regulator of sigma E protease